MGDDRHRIGTDGRGCVIELGAARLFLAEGPAEERRGAENGKEVLAHLRGDQDFGVGVAADRAACAVEARNAVEARRPQAPVVDIPARGAGALDTQLGIGVEDAHEPFRMWVRQRPEQDAAHQREQDRAHANPDAHRRHGQHRDAGRATKHADRIEGFSRQLFELEPAARLGELLAGRVDAAKLAPRLASRFCFIEARTPLLVDQQLDVVRELLGRLAIEAAGRHELQNVPPERSHHSLFSTRIMAVAVRSQAFCWIVMRRRPAAVSA